jgi:hypothetical protein
MRWLWAMTFAGAALAQARPEVTISGGGAEAVFDIGGGSLTVFRLSGGLNPLRWLGPADQNAALRPMAHFLCLDRWGQPSAEESRNGMPFHGEATRVPWKAEPGGANRVRMTASLPMAGLDVERAAALSTQGAILHVSEKVTNRNKLGKVYNMVQHPTIGPPFLDEQTVVDSNARRGFMQSTPGPNFEEPSVFWPQALRDGAPVNLRMLGSDPNPNVVSFVVEEALGWTTASSVSQGLLIGYVWKTADYPWFNVWRHVDGSGKPLARGLEFGTTGLHQPFGTLLAKNRIFGRRLFAYLEPGESATRSFLSFLAPIPKDWKGTDRVAITGGVITISERGQRKVEVQGVPEW